MKKIVIDCSKPEGHEGREQITSLSAEEVKEIEQKEKSILVANAKISLHTSDIVAIRCFKAGIQYPETWKNRDDILREIIDTENGIIPEEPEGPEGI